MKRTGNPQRTMGLKRTPLRARYRDTGPSAAVVAVVGERDAGRCAVCGEQVGGIRGYDWSVQHRLRRGGGGTVREFVNQPANLVLFCGGGTTACHGLVERRRLWSERRGYRVVDGIVLPADTPIDHAVHGRVLLDDEGGWTPCPTSGSS